MTRALQLPELRDLMARHSVGASWFNDLTSQNQNYPPHNILQLSENDFQVVLAVAGFSREEIEIQVEHSTLTISGKIGDRKSADPSSEYPQVLHKGIAERDFSRDFKLGEHIEIVGASLSDGILRVNLTRVVPEALKPRVIEIS